MNSLKNLTRNNAPRVLALGILGILWGLSRTPLASATELKDLSSQFSFKHYTLPNASGYPLKSMRSVNPDFKNINNWVSSVGASVVFGDLSRTGLPNDIAYVDTQTNQVVIAPVPGTGDRFQSFVLRIPNDGYNSKTYAPTGVKMADFNNDGLLDVLVFFWGRPPILFIQKNHAGPLSNQAFVPMELIKNHERWYTDAVDEGDLDGSGHLDIIVGNYFPDGGHVLDSASSVPDHMQRGMSRAKNGGTIHILKWVANDPKTGLPEYVGVSDALPKQARTGWCLALGLHDFTGDLLPELYIANDFGPDHLLLNVSTNGHIKFHMMNGTKNFFTPASYQLGHDSFKGMGVDFGDINGDGLTDMFVSNIGTPYGLEESNFAWINTGGGWSKGIAPFKNEADALNLQHSGWAWDVKIADFNNSGQPQIVQATGFDRGSSNGWAELQQLAMGNDSLLQYPRFWPDFTKNVGLNAHDTTVFYVKGLDGKYVNIGPEIGLDDTVSRGIATADVLGNGEEDLAVANQWAPSSFYMNTLPVKKDYLELRLLLSKQQKRTLNLISGYPTVPNTINAITAQATVYLPNGKTVTSQIDNGNGHSGQRDTNMFFGLGQDYSGQVFKLQLKWRDASGVVHSENTEVAAGFYTVVLPSSRIGGDK